MENQMERVARMEEIYDRCCGAVEALLLAARQYQEAEASLRELEKYYTGPAWMEDFDAERADFFPKDMKRGILTEDAIYDLLTDEYRMKKLLRKLR